MAITRSYVASTASTANATSYTYTNHNIGTAAADRYVTVGVASLTSASTAPNITGFTIGGNNATQRKVTNGTTMFVYTITALYNLLVTSGTQATIVVTFDQTMTHCVVSVWAVYGGKAEAFHTNGNNNESDGTFAVSTTLNIPDQGVGIAMAYLANNNVAHTAGGLTEDADAVVESSSRYHAMSSQSMSAETGRTISSTGTASTFRNISAGSWQAAGGGIIRPQPTRFFPGRRFLRPEKKKLFVQPKLLLPAGYKRAA